LKVSTNVKIAMKCFENFGGAFGAPGFMSKSAVRLFLGSALTISFGLACRGCIFDRSAFNVLFQNV